MKVSCSASIGRQVLGHDWPPPRPVRLRHHVVATNGPPDRLNGPQQLTFGSKVVGDIARFRTSAQKMSVFIYFQKLITFWILGVREKNWYLDTSTHRDLFISDGFGTDKVHQGYPNLPNTDQAKS